MIRLNSEKFKNFNFEPKFAIFEEKSQKWIRMNSRVRAITLNIILTETLLWLGLMPQNFSIVILEPKVAIFIKNHENDD